MSVAQYTPAPQPVAHFPQAVGQPIPPPSKYALLELLSVLPLEGPEGERQRQKAIADSAWFKSRIQTIPQPTPMDRVGLAFINSTTGATLVDQRKIDNAGMRMASAATDLTTAQIQTLILTRWTLPPEVGGEPLLVDVVEHRSMGINSYYVKTTRDVQLKLRDKHVTKMKGNKSWSKKFNTTPVDTVAVLEKDRSETRLDQVLRLQRPISAVEAVALVKSFEKEWMVPSPV